MINNAPPHKPVLVDEVVTLLQPRSKDKYLDLTAGYGGHASAVLQHLDSSTQLTLVDRDVFAFEYLNSLPQFNEATIVHSSFKTAVAQFKQNHMKFDMILLDLGVSSPQLDIDKRGFSFRNDGPLDMRMDQTQDLTAKEVVNSYSKEQLTEMIEKYGDISNPDTVVRLILKTRPFLTTRDLSSIFETKQHYKIHPATRVFQAIRLEVNNEIGQLEDTLTEISSIMNTGARLAIISFHSLEDRIVKEFFKRMSRGYEKQFSIATKKPISGKINDVNNIRARSAQLRVVSKI